jgi:hypothetical protein
VRLGYSRDLISVSVVTRMVKTMGKHRRKRPKKGKKETSFETIEYEKKMDTRSEERENTIMYIRLLELPFRIRNQKALIPNTCRTSLVKRNESRTGRRSNSASSAGSEYQPSIGMPFAGCQINIGHEILCDTLQWRGQN